MLPTKCLLLAISKDGMLCWTGLWHDLIQPFLYVPGEHKKAHPQAQGEEQGFSFRLDTKIIFSGVDSL